MSSLETAWEFRQLTRYLIACEDYGPWEGITSPDMIREFSAPRERYSRVWRTPLFVATILIPITIRRTLASSPRRAWSR